jgi:hypothetical protein
MGTDAWKNTVPRRRGRTGAEASQPVDDLNIAQLGRQRDQPPAAASCGKRNKPSSPL